MSLDTDGKLVNEWGEYVQRVTTELSGRWHFRGALDNWDLEPSLQRAAIDWGVDMAELPLLEKQLLRDFKRAYPANADIQPPLDDDTLAWLSLMQHYGAPTRLLDWTYSPFVAAFFALDILLATRDPNRKAAIWALSAQPTSNAAIKVLLPNESMQKAFEQYSITRKGEPFESVFMKADPPVAFVSPVNPYKLNQRLVVQQGLFLCQGDIRYPFEENLRAVPEATEPVNLRKFLLPRSILSDAFMGLHRMNISYSTLFPGIDGYSRNLRHRVAFIRSGRLFDATQY